MYNKCNKNVSACILHFYVFVQIYVLSILLFSFGTWPIHGSATYKARDIRNQEDAFNIDHTKNKTYLDPKSFYHNVSSYKKTSAGSEMWHAKSDLANLPFVALGSVTDAIDAQIKACTIPHQQLLNVNALLGKQEGCRTISKTPMMWRMIGKCDTVVKDGSPWRLGLSTQP